MLTFITSFKKQNIILSLHLQKKRNIIIIILKLTVHYGFIYY